MNLLHSAPPFNPILPTGPPGLLPMLDLHACLPP